MDAIEENLLAIEMRGKQLCTKPKYECRKMLWKCWHFYNVSFKYTKVFSSSDIYWNSIQMLFCLQTEQIKKEENKNKYLNCTVYILALVIVQGYWVSRQYWESENRLVACNKMYGL